MKFKTVTVRYGELRTDGHFNNTKVEVELTATVSEADRPRAVKDTLLRYAKESVSDAFLAEERKREREVPF